MHQNPTTLPGVLANSKMVLGESDTHYHSQRTISSSSLLKKALVSPAHYLTACSAPASEPTEAQRLGLLAHVLTLEPGVYSEKFATFTGADSTRSSTYRTWLGKQGSRLILSSEELALGKSLAQKLHDTNIGGNRFGDIIRDAKTEASIYYEDVTTGLPCRVRHDCWHEALGQFDVKTTRHESVEGFIRQAIDLDYDLQAFMYSYADVLYLGGNATRPFTFVVINTSTPHSVFVLRAGQSFLENGRKKYESAIATVAASTQTAYWPDASCEQTIEIAPWQAI